MGDDNLVGLGLVGGCSIDARGANGPIHCSLKLAPLRWRWAHLRFNNWIQARIMSVHNAITLVPQEWLLNLIATQGVEAAFWVGVEAEIQRNGESLLSFRRVLGEAPSTQINWKLPSPT